MILFCVKYVARLLVLEPIKHTGNLKCILVHIKLVSTSEISVSYILQEQGGVLSNKL
jgi:hypothetical protein